MRISGNVVVLPRQCILASVSGVTQGRRDPSGCFRLLVVLSVGL